MRKLPVCLVIAGVLTTSLIAPGRYARAEDGARLALIDAIRRSLVRFPTVGLAADAREEAIAGAREARSGLYPTLSLIGSVNEYEKPMPVTPIHGFTLRQIPPFDETLIQGGVVLDYLLFDGGGREARIRTADARVAAADAASASARQALMARVAVAYLDVVGKREMLSAHDQRVGSLAAQQDRVRRLRDVGRAADLEVLRVEAAVKNAEAERVRSSTALDAAERNLAYLIDTSFAAVHSVILTPITQTDTAQAAHDVLMAQAVRANPTIEQSRRQLAAAGAARAMAQGARWPSLHLSANYIDRGDKHGGYAAEWSGGIALSYPLFTGGALSGGISGADAGVRAASDQLRLAEIQLRLELDRARSAQAESQARVASLAAAVDRFAEVVRIEKLRLETGSGTQVDYLAAETDLLLARANLIEARHARIAAQVELARITGQLSPEWITLNLEQQP